MWNGATWLVVQLDAGEDLRVPQADHNDGDCPMCIMEYTLVGRYN